MTQTYGTFSGRRPSQMEQELNAFKRLLSAEGVMSYLEIGARHGDTFHEVMAWLAASRALCEAPPGTRARGVAVDLPGAAWGKEGTSGVLLRAASAVRSMGADADVLIGDSQTVAMREQVYAHAPFDAVLIDGDHRYEGVSRDFGHYGGMSRIVAFHDIVGTGQMDKARNRVEVPIFWEELKVWAATNKHRVVELIAPDSKMGIGVIIKAEKGYGARA